MSDVVRHIQLKQRTKPENSQGLLKQRIMISKRIHWTTKLKAENARLKSDIYKILDGDFITVTLYQTYRKLEKDTERIMWFGDTDSLLSKTKD